MSARSRIFIGVIHKQMEIFFLHKFSLPFLDVCLPLLNILAKAAASDGFSATIKAFFISKNISRRFSLFKIQQSK